MTVLSNHSVIPTTAVTNGAYSDDHILTTVEVVSRHWCSIFVRNTGAENIDVRFEASLTPDGDMWYELDEYLAVVPDEVAFFPSLFLFAFYRIRVQCKESNPGDSSSVDGEILIEMN